MGSGGRGHGAEVMQLFHLDTARFRRAPNHFPSGAPALPPLRWTTHRYGEGGIKWSTCGFLHDVFLQ